MQTFTGTNFMRHEIETALNKTRAEMAQNATAQIDNRLTGGALTKENAEPAETAIASAYLRALQSRLRSRPGPQA
jgi:hypothetical protein